MIRSMRIRLTVFGIISIISLGIVMARSDLIALICINSHVWSHVDMYGWPSESYDVVFHVRNIGIFRLTYLRVCVSRSAAPLAP